MSDLAEMAHMVNAASLALEKLSGSYGGGNARRKFLRSIYASINQARLRGASIREIAESITASTGVRITSSSLHYHLQKLQAEEKVAAQKISRTIAQAKTTSETSKNS